MRTKFKPGDMVSHNGVSNSVGRVLEAQFGLVRVDWLKNAPPGHSVFPENQLSRHPFVGQPSLMEAIKQAQKEFADLPDVEKSIHYRNDAIRESLREQDPPQVAPSPNQPDTETLVRKLLVELLTKAGVQLEIPPEIPKYRADPYIPGVLVQTVGGKSERGYFDKDGCWHGVVFAGHDMTKLPGYSAILNALPTSDGPTHGCACGVCGQVAPSPNTPIPQPVPGRVDDDLHEEVAATRRENKRRAKNAWGREPGTYIGDTPPKRGPGSDRG